MDEIIEFSEIEKFIDTPVKRYSSGMYVRLAFAVAANLDSEILLADEVLAVGDTAFQKKCLGKMEDVSRREGRTVLFVSHNIPAVKQLCSKGIYLERGRISGFDSIDKAIAEYMGKAIGSKSSWNGSGTAQKSKHLRICSIDLVDADGKNVEGIVENTERVFLCISFELLQQGIDLAIGARLYNSSDESIYRSLNTDFSDSTGPAFNLGMNRLSCELPISFLKPDSYFAVVDASIYHSEWIINPGKDKEYSVGFALVNSSFGSRHETTSLIAPVIKWESR